MMYWNGNGMNGWGYAMMGVSNLVFWALLLAVGVMVFRYATRPLPGGGRGDDRNAEKILADRFARGEIDADEYAGRLATLRNHAGAPPGGPRPGA
jgi:putative membrane protein